MKNHIQTIKKWWNNCAMKTKLTLSFSFVIIFIFIFLMILLYIILAQSSKKSMLFSADQSYQQAYSFLCDYYNTLTYASDLIYYNGDLQRILSSDDFLDEKDYSIRYREFLTLDQVLSSAEMNDIIFQAKIYIPDQIIYTNNMVHFAPLSKLETRDDYNDFISPKEHFKIYLTNPRDISIPGNNKTVNQISILRKINSTNGFFKFPVIEEISMKSSLITDLIKNANITKNGFVYLINRKGAQIGIQKDVSNYPSYDAECSWNETVYLDKIYYIKKRQIFNNNWMLIAMIPKNEIYAQSIQTRYIFTVISIITVIMVSFISYLLSNSYTQRINRLMEAMQKVQKGNLTVEKEFFGYDEIGKLYHSFIYMANELKTLMHKQYIYGQMAKNSELKALQAQINPHFLYNTLDLINWEAMDHDAPEIAKIVRELATYYRLSLNNGQQFTTIKDELNHVKTYVEIENYHFDNAIKLTINIPEELLSLACIHIIIQPFIENSIMHGMGNSLLSQSCNIKINGKLDNKILLLTIQDDGVGMTPEQINNILLNKNINKDMHGYGINNINSRIILCYGEEYGLLFESCLNKGTTVTIKIPAMTIEEAKRHFETDTFNNKGDIGITDEFK